MAKTCTECGKKFDLFWLGDDKLCRSCFIKRRDDAVFATGNWASESVPNVPIRQHSFSAANGLFDFLTFIAWIVMLLGVLLMLFGVMQSRDFASTLLSLISGATMVISGLVFLALVQIGRATVHTAETNSEMLALARKAEARAQESGLTINR